jgi:hypothetical protein
VIPVADLLAAGAAGGAAALGIDDWPGIEVDLDHPSLGGVAPSEAHAALVHGCGADVFTPSRDV